MTRFSFFAIFQPCDSRSDTKKTDAQPVRESIVARPAAYGNAPPARRTRPLALPGAGSVGGVGAKEGTFGGREGLGVKAESTGKLLRIFVGERDRWKGQPLYTAIVEVLRKRGFAGATVFKGIEGFGGHSVIHAARVIDMAIQAPCFTIPAATGDPDGTLQILVTNLDYSEYFGRIAICRVFQGTLHAGDDVTISKRDGSLMKTRITKLFTFSGLKRIETTETAMGDIVAVAGVEGITIGETITSVENPAPLPLIVIDEPTIAIQFSVNNSPFAGREGQYVTSRNLRERLEKELLTNVSIRVEDTGSPDSFKVLGRGELQLAILIEMMRRESFELMAGRPEIVTKMVDGTAWSRSST